MLILITLLLLIITSIALFTFNYLLRRQNFVWLITLLGVVSAFISIWFWRGALPVSVQLFSGSEFLSLNPNLTVGPTGWSIIIVLFASTLSLLMSVSSTGLRHSSFFYWSILIAFLIISILSIEAGNLYVTIMAFGALDALETLILIRSKKTSSTELKLPITNLTIQTFGLFLMLIAALGIGLNKPFGDINEISNRNSLFLVLGLFFRVNVIFSPTSSSQTESSTPWHNNIDLYKLVALVVLVSHLPDLALSQFASFIFQVTFAIFALYSAWTWMTTQGTSTGFKHFFNAVAFIAFFNNLIGTQLAASALVIFSILLTSFLNQPARHERFLAVLMVIISFLSLGLPYTYSSTIWQSTHTRNILSLFVLPLAHYLLVFGFIRHAFEDEEDTSAKGLRILTLISASFMTILILIFGVWGWEGAANFGVAWVYIPILIFYSAGLFAIFRFRNVLRVLINVKMPFVGGGLTALSNWTSIFSNWSYGLLQTFVDAITSLSEGKGALLWTVLILLVVLLSLQGGF